MDFPQDVLDILDFLVGEPSPEPAMFTSAWWNSPYSEPYLAANQSRSNRKRFVWPQSIEGQRYAQYDANYNST